MKEDTTTSFAIIDGNLKHLVPDVGWVHHPGNWSWGYHQDSPFAHLVVDGVVCEDDGDDVWIAEVGVVA